MIGLEVTHRALLSEQDQAMLARSGRVGEFVAQLLGFFRAAYLEVFGTPIAPIHDAAAVAHLLNPELIATQPANVEVETESELTRGETVVDLLAVSGRAVNARVGVDVDSAGFAELLTTRIIESWGER
jgi:purine nucleosidase